ncbi:diphthine methyl ester synthase [Anopheles arabiensis]|uniref:diphthine methyl ester synthase n=3 Tax=gambiae species complex TaxID=44542 RepID=Q7QA67_ANOGA|nr:diphthine methyl ester synthase [Anopheles arabiensis]XP_313697.4 diphthine methyl ester synthase [Anopheles gambiae]EAA09127.4 AGAP004412-PA [Anopheles gambiae str. PEST]
MFYIIGLGLGDPEDITVKGLNIIKQCERVYLESYTSVLCCGQEKLEEFYGRKLILADREMVEQRADDILEGAESVSVAFLVVGDPFGATTHTDLMLRAKEKGIKTSIVHNASIMNAVGCCGLQLYHFGETVSIPYWDDSWKPDSFYDKIVANLKHGLHTLCLLDIKVKEPTLESLMKKKREYMPPRFMSVSEAADQLLQIVAKKSDAEAGVQPDQQNEHGLSENTLIVGLARVGHDTQQILACSLSEMRNVDLGPPLHSLIIPNGQLHPLEMEFLQQFAELKQQIL